MKNFIIQLFLKRKKSKLQKTEKKLQIKRKTCITYIFLILITQINKKQIVCIKVCTVLLPYKREAVFHFRGGGRTMRRDRELSS